MRSCGTVAKADGNRENKLRPVVTEGSYLLDHDIENGELTEWRNFFLSLSYYYYFPL
jgi:hypothetical protein